MTGVVKELDWTNPHVSVWVYKDAKPGEAPELWNFEVLQPRHSDARRLDQAHLQPGDKVKIIYDPLRSGAAAGQLPRPPCCPPARPMI